MSKSHPTKKKWSAEVTAHSDALDLEPHVFTMEDPSEIADSLKRSAESSGRRKSSAFQSAMSTLNLYVNRAGRNLPAGRKRTLEAAKAKTARPVRPKRLAIPGGLSMSGDKSPPDPTAARGLPQDRGREKRQPYAAEHEDYNDNVAETPKEQGDKLSPSSRRTAPRKV